MRTPRCKARCSACSVRSVRCATMAVWTKTHRSSHRSASGNGSSTSLCTTSSIGNTRRKKSERQRSSIAPVKYGDLMGMTPNPGDAHSIDTAAVAHARNAAGSTASAAAPVRIRSIVGGLAGNLIEWYDFLAYSIFSIYFAKSFFPSDKPTVQLMNTAAIAAVGYVARPLGSWLIGLYADRRGRKSALTWSVTAMCIGSLMIAITPGYATIGVFAPVVLILARLLQGLSMGGEYGTSATYLSEIAPANRRGFYLGFLQVSVVAGQLLALGLMLLMQHVLLTAAQIERWGWRIPFVVGGALALFALYMRRNVVETEAFTHGAQHAGSSVAREMLLHWRQILLALGITVGGTVAFYTYTVYMQKFLVNTMGLGKETATFVSAGALLLYMPLQPLFGLASDVVGRR